MCSAQPGALLWRESTCKPEHQHIDLSSTTVAWSTPELFIDEPKAFALYVYALAITLCEAFKRLVPFRNMPVAVVVSQVLAGVRPTLQKVPPDAQSIIKLA